MHWENGMVRIIVADARQVGDSAQWQRQYDRHHLGHVTKNQEVNNI